MSSEAAFHEKKEKKSAAKYLTRDYYDRYKVAGFGKLRHIFPEPHFPRSLIYPPIIIPSWLINEEIDKIVTGKI